MVNMKGFVAILPLEGTIVYDGEGPLLLDHDVTLHEFPNFLCVVLSILDFIALLFAIQSPFFRIHRRFKALVTV